MGYEESYGKLTKNVNGRLEKYALNYEERSVWDDAVKYFSDESNFTTVSKKIAEIIKKKYAKEFESNEELYTFVVEKFKKNNVPIDEAGRTLKNWLKLKPDELAPTQKDLAIKICFALKLSPEESECFIEKALYIRPFNFKSIKDTVYYFGINNRLSYDDTIKIFDELDNAESNDFEKKETNIVIKEIARIITKNELIEYINKNRNMYNSNLVAAKKIFNVELNTTVERLKEKYSHIEDSDIKVGRETVLTLVYAKSRNEINKSIKNSTLLKYIKKNLPNSQVFNSIVNETKDVSEDAIRKAIILLHFYNFFGFNDEEVNREMTLDFFAEMNDCLEECSLPTLYPMNPYDAIIMMFAYTSDPIYYLTDFFTDAFNV